MRLWVWGQLWLTSLRGSESIERRPKKILLVRKSFVNFDVQEKPELHVVRASTVDENDANRS